MYYTIGGEIYHHQRLGAKWGVMHGPPYPLERGEFSKPGKKLKKGNVMDYLKSRKRKKQQRKALEKARATKIQNAEKRKSEEEHAAAREKALRSGTAEEVLKYQGELTSAQLQEVLNRLSNESKLAEIARKDNPPPKSVTDKVDDIVNKLDKVTTWTKKGIEVYNTAAKVINAFSDDADLPIVGTDTKHTRSNRELENKNKEMDNKIKQLQLENSKLKNKEQELRNEDLSLKNEQTRKNQQKQKEKEKEDKEKEKEIKSPFGKAAEEHKKATDEALKKVEEAEKKKKKKK